MMWRLYTKVMQSAVWVSVKQYSHSYWDSLLVVIWVVSHGSVISCVSGIELVKKLLRTEPMQKLGARLNDKPLPGCESFPFDTKIYWECYIRHLTLTSYHPAGTCKMGPRSDAGAVVNSNLMWVMSVIFRFQSDFYALGTRMKCKNIHFYLFSILFFFSPPAKFSQGRSLDTPAGLIPGISMLLSRTG